MRLSVLKTSSKDSITSDSQYKARKYMHKNIYDTRQMNYITYLQHEIIKIFNSKK